MPLAFDSISHGRVAFGFFNIETDMLLLEHYFFFSTDFCERIPLLAERSAGGGFETGWRGYTIDDPERIGDLHGAIAGFRYTGFIGDLYRTYPFPVQPKDFKQNPDGHRNRDAVAERIAVWADPVKISLAADPGGSEIRVNEYRFERTVFQGLAAYVWQGGYPRWRDGIRPAHVRAMKDRLTGNPGKIFRGLNLQL